MRSDLRSRRAARAGMAGLVAALLMLPAAAGAAPKTPKLGPLIEDFQPYVGQSTCKPKTKPGVRRFAKLLLKAYGPAPIGTSRACSVGGQSEHKEGRALDWAKDASVAADRATVNDLFAWLFATDERGNEDAIARRLGLMYVIWNRKMWSSWTGDWEVICVQKKKKCVDPDDGHVVHPHRDHVHFSFGWPGARRRTSFFQRERSMVVGIASNIAGDGYWLAGGDGSVTPFGTGFFGSKKEKALGKVAVGMAARPSGLGYWLVLRNGRVFAFGDAPFLGRVSRKRGRIVDIETTPSGNGYWVVGRGGRVDAFGDAPALGGATKAKVVGMSSTPSGAGYFLFSSTGVVHAFGDAQLAGDAAGAGPVAGGAVHPGGGYWLVNRGGKVHAFGSAAAHGNATVGPAAGMASTPSGGGYWVAGRFGAVQALGDATAHGSL